MDKIVVVHFSPPELYPPVQNLLNELAARKPKQTRLYVFTTAPLQKHLSLFRCADPEVRIMRVGVSGKSMGRIRRYLNYIFHYAMTLFYLIKIKPGKLLYYESISSFAPVIYKKYFNKKVPLYIHYHEYSSPKEYDDGPPLIKYFHALEKKIYTEAMWISHTNKYRMNMFKADVHPVILNNDHTFANYPSVRWHTKPNQRHGFPIRIIYAGACSMDSMYTKEFAEWVIACQGKVKWDIYSYNITPDAREYFSTIDTDLVRLKPGVDYDQLPHIFSQYDVGIILYKGNILNHIYNAPNKLFEYLLTGLDVWYPDKIKGCFEYDSTELWPKVLRLDFDKLKNYSLVELVERKSENQREINYNCEKESELLIYNLLK